MIHKTDQPRFFQIRCDKQFLDDLDRLRKLEDDLPTRTDLIRRLVARALKAHAETQARKR